LLLVVCLPAAVTEGEMIVLYNDFHP